MIITQVYKSGTQHWLTLGFVILLRWVPYKVQLCMHSNWIQDRIHNSTGYKTHGIDYTGYTVTQDIRYR